MSDPRIIPKDERDRMVAGLSGLRPSERTARALAASHDAMDERDAARVALIRELAAALQRWAECGDVISGDALARVPEELWP